MHRTCAESDECFTEISAGDVGVLGVTTVDDELFVLLHQESDQVTVYSINDYQLVRHLNLPGFKPDPFSDLTSCVRYRCLYMSDCANKCIDIYDLVSSAISKWPVPGKPYGLSVTPSCNLLVTCQEPNKLVELSAESGQCVHEIRLQSDIVGPYHGIKLTTGQFVICHCRGKSLHRVCTVDGNGAVTRSYGGQRSSDVGQLKWPLHLAEHKRLHLIIVVECENGRIVLLSRALQFLSYICKRLSSPHRLHFDNTTRRLYVGQVLGDIVVIQL